MIKYQSYIIPPYIFYLHITKTSQYHLILTIALILTTVCRYFECRECICNFAPEIKHNHNNKLKEKDYDICCFSDP